MAQAEMILKTLADFLWGNWLMYALLGLGFLCTLATGSVQVRRFREAIVNFIRDMKQDAHDSGKQVSGVQALLAAVGSCVGSGNIVGVSTAILSGGAGALFWMWVAAFLGMATKFCEIVLGMLYRQQREDGEYLGGPMYYIGQGLKAPWLGALVAVLLFVQNAGGTFIQANTIANVMRSNFQMPVLLTGAMLGISMLYIITGGFRRLVGFARRIVPFMALLYVGTGLLVIFANAASLPRVFADIFTQAFTFQAASGAAAGFTIRQAMRYGVARGIYSNEAGEGSAAVIHSTANTPYPARQGLYGILEVFVDTMIICTTTGLAILTTGMITPGAAAPTLAANAFGSVFAPLRYVVTLSLVLFAFTSLMSQWYFGHVSLRYLKSEIGAKLYRLLFPLAILFGSGVTVEIVWSIQDCALGLLILPNIVALVLLLPKVRQSLKAYQSHSE